MPPIYHQYTTKVPIFSKIKKQYYNFYETRKILYEMAYFIYENEKNTFHKVFWTFRKVRQVSHKKYANMSLKNRGQSIKSTKDVYFLRRDKMDCLYINRDKRTY